MSIKQRSKTNKPNKLLMRLIYAALLFIVVAIFVGKSFYNKIYAPNITVTEGTEYFYIPTGSDFEDVCIALEEAGYLKDVDGFKWVAEQKNYINIKPGRYRIKNNWTNNDLVNKLRSGNQTPVKVTLITSEQWQSWQVK